MAIRRSYTLNLLNLSFLEEPEVVYGFITIVKWLITAFIVLIAVSDIRAVLDSFITSSLHNVLQTVRALPSSPQLSAQHKGNIDYADIVKNNIFGVIAPPRISKKAPKPRTKLPLQLVGVFITEGEPPYAIIENKRKKTQDAFGIGEEIFGEAKLVKVEPDKVEIERNGVTEELTLDIFGKSRRRGGKVGGIIEEEPGEFVIDEEELDKALDNLPLLLQQARAVPYFKNGRSVGLRLFAIRPNSFYSKIGLRNGDILKKINGKDLGDLSEALKLFEELKEERSFDVVIERNRVEKELHYEVR
ncbi:MAG: hypothetical protein D6808_03470 [Candidatus Dadabacteria bacterium]|nr:MAG: hypothetical protein D6808_03470 [Candidatus Dadabacteria bacterium]